MRRCPHFLFRSDSSISGVVLLFRRSLAPAAAYFVFVHTSDMHLMPGLKLERNFPLLEKESVTICCVFNVISEFKNCLEAKKSQDLAKKSRKVGSSREMQDTRNFTLAMFP